MRRLLSVLVVLVVTSSGCDLSDKPPEEGRSVSDGGLEQTVPANGVLSTLSVTEWKPEKCPPDWPGPWTACPEAGWCA